jgi:hypothetical protein
MLASLHMRGSAKGGDDAASRPVLTGFTLYSIERLTFALQGTKFALISVKEPQRFDSLKLGCSPVLVPNTLGVSRERNRYDLFSS